ncbi:MAG: L-threonine 3-dehydrogenase [Bacilli bacterium]|nr:L-threonine 3-dehydrogenase [Bacilli bacterium]MBN2876822.1 L-threonine 3-dehydrogenase [Bacilli bacterium]
MMAAVKDKEDVGFSYVKKTISTVLEPGEVLIKVITASFCGTDYHIYQYDKWSQSRLHLPYTVGHEFSGEIIKIASDVTNVKVGDIVSAETHITCGTCEFCLRGEAHICENTKVIGVDVDGCFADYVRIPAKNCFVNEKHHDQLQLSVQEPLGNAVHTITHFPIEGRDVVVLGCGPIGIMAVDVAKAYKARKVIAIEINEYRRNLAKELGADYIIDPLSEDVHAKVMEYTNGKGADVIGDFSGNKIAIETAFKYLKAGGGFAILGIPNDAICIDVTNDVVFHGIRIYGVTGRRINETWDKVKYLLNNNMLHLDKVITHTFPLSKINEAAEVMGSKNCGKIVLFPGR